MKKTLIYLTIAGAGLFASCTRSNMGTSVPDKTISVASGMAPDSLHALLTYELITRFSHQPDGLVQWKSGYMSVTMLDFNVIHVKGNAISRDNYNLNTNTSINVFSTSPAIMGTMGIPVGTYTVCNSDFIIHPYQSNVSSLYLEGTFYPANDSSNPGGMLSKSAPVNVIVMINDPITMTGAWQNNMTFTGNTPYYALFTLDMSYVTSQINMEMMNHAQQTNGTMVISPTSNQNLYQIIAGNLTSAVTLSLGQ